MHTDPRQTLDAVLQDIWRHLYQAADEQRHGFRLMQLATIATDDSPQVRTVVLRAVDADKGLLRFHTDRRAPKVAEMRRSPRVALLAYDSERRQQLRLQGEATLHADDAIADAAWHDPGPSNRLDYCSDAAPGTPIADPATAQQPIPPADAGRSTFMAVRVCLDVIDWLQLARSGHRRARWQRRGTGWHGSWLTP